MYKLPCEKYGILLEGLSSIADVNYFIVYQSWTGQFSLQFKKQHFQNITDISISNTTLTSSIIQALTGTYFEVSK